MELISREAIMKLTKEMYLEIANTEYDVHTISDCTSYVASKCREYVDEHIQRKDIPSAFEGMTNGDVLKAIFPDCIDYHGIIEVKTHLDMGKTFRRSWWDSPYKGQDGLI